MITASQIRRAEFSRVAMGYKANEVDDILEDAAATVDRLQKQNEELTRKLDILADKVKQYRADEDNIKQALVTAQRTAEKIVKEAEAESEKTIADAKSESDAKIKDAVQKATEILSAAEADAKNIVAETKSRALAAIVDTKDKSGRMALEINDLRKKEDALYGEMTRRAADFREKLLKLYEEQIELIKALPDKKITVDAADVPDLDSLTFEEPEIPSAQVKFADEITEEPIEKDAKEEKEIEDISSFSNDFVGGDADVKKVEDGKFEIKDAAEETPENGDASSDDGTFKIVDEENNAEQKNSTRVMDPASFTKPEQPVEGSQLTKFSNLKFGDNYNPEEDEYDDEDDDDAGKPKRGFFRRKK